MCLYFINVKYNMFLSLNSVGVRKVAVGHAYRCRLTNPASHEGEATKGLPGLESILSTPGQNNSTLSGRGRLLRGYLLPSSTTEHAGWKERTTSYKLSCDMHMVYTQKQTDIQTHTHCLLISSHYTYYIHNIHHTHIHTTHSVHHTHITHTHIHTNTTYIQTTHMQHTLPRQIKCNKDWELYHDG